MMLREKPTIVFVINLLQDVSIVWNLALLVAEKTSYSVQFLVSENFRNKDSARFWTHELEQLRSKTGARLDNCSSLPAAVGLLRGKSGVLIAASESSLNPHRFVHDLFHTAPTSFTKITLQHGYECPGFRQNREQSKAFSSNVRFAADFICSWTAADRLTHTSKVDLAKVVVTGPTSLILRPRSLDTQSADAKTTGIVCENLHSTRMVASGDFRLGYMDTFQAFGTVMEKKGRKVALRPHPGGQYVVKNGVALAPGLELQNEPMYRLDLSQYAYGISAPSSVLIDMVLAGIPTAVWRDPDGLIDCSAYDGLAQVSSLGEWIAFADAAIADPKPFLDAQMAFLERTGIVRDSEEIGASYLGLIRGACGHGSGSRSRADSKRVLFVANAEIPTLQICFLKPLEGLFEAGVLDARLITEGQVRKAMGSKGDLAKGEAWFAREIADHKPDMAVFCRYSGPLTDAMIACLKKEGVPIIYHIDDDLMNVPREIGEAKYREHNSPERLISVASGLGGADLVYCSTQALLDRLRYMGFSTPMQTGEHHCAGEILRKPRSGPVKRIGYMGFDHSHDLAMVLPSIERLLDKWQDVTFELFGTIPVPDQLTRFGERIRLHLPVRPYAAFIAHLAELEWDIGICPLADTVFNRYKANNKWVEYTSTGAAVVATAGMAYDHCCSDGCGVLVDRAENWFDALDRLCSDDDAREIMITRAQRHLLEDYSIKKLRGQILSIFDRISIK